MSALRWIYILTALLALLDTKRTKVHGGKIKEKVDTSRIRSDLLVIFCVVRRLGIESKRHSHARVHGNPMTTSYSFLNFSMDSAFTYDRKKSYGAQINAFLSRNTHYVTQNCRC